MARIRSLHPGQASDEDFVGLSMEARYFCLMLRCHADDYGVFEWKPKTLKMKIFPADNIDVVPLLDELQDANQVKQFTVDGKSYGAFRNFRKWQKPKTPSSLFPLPNELRSYVGLSGGVSDKSGNEGEIDDQKGGREEIRREDGGDSSEDKSSGAEAPPPAGDVSRETQWKQIYAGLKRHLGTKSGGLISKLRQVSGEAEMANWLDACDRGEIADPREYFSKIIAAREGKPPPNEKPDPEKAFRQKAQMVAKGMRSKEMYSMQELDRMINEGLVTQEQAKVFGWKDPFEFRVPRPTVETEGRA